MGASTKPNWSYMIGLYVANEIGFVSENRLLGHKHKGISRNQPRILRVFAWPKNLGYPTEN